MAKLKQAVSEVKYVDQIGINQGGGFAVAARGQIQTANALNQIVSEWSQFALEETKEWGKKLGEKKAKDLDIGEQEVTYSDPKNPNLKRTEKIPIQVETPTYLTTASSIEAFEKNIFLKYQKEVQATVDDILNEERANAEKNYDTAESFESIVDARLVPLFKSLDPTFKQLIETYSKTKVSNAVRMVASKYDRHQELIKGVTFTAEINAARNELDKALIYDNLDLIDEKVKDYNEIINVAQGNNVIMALGTGNQNKADVKAKVNAFKLFSGIHIKNYDEASPLELSIAINNYKKLGMLVSFKGPNEVTLDMPDGSIKQISKKDLNEVLGDNLRVFEDIGSALVTQANLMNSILGTKVNATTHHQWYDFNLKNGGKDARLPPDKTRKQWTKDIFSAEYLPTHVAKYNTLLDSSEHITAAEAPYDIRFIKYILTEQHALSPIKKQEIETAYTSFNQRSIEDLRNESIITFMNDFKHTFNKEIDGGNKDFTISLDIHSVVGISKDIQNRIFTVENKLRLNDDLAKAITSTAEFYSKFEKGVYTTLAQAVAAGSGNRITNPQEINNYINETVVDLLDRFTIREPSLAQTLALIVKQEVHEYLMKGHPIEVLGDLDSAIKASMKSVLDGDTGFGFSKYTYSPFVNMKYSQTDYSNRQAFVMDPLETYALPEKGKDVTIEIMGAESTYRTDDGEMTINWMLPSIEKLIKDSPSYDSMKNFMSKDFKNDFGEMIKLQSTGVGTSKFPKYNLVWVQKNGMSEFITDELGLPIFYDPYLEYKELHAKLIIEDELLDKQINDYKLQRSDKLKNYKKITVAEMLMMMD